MGSGGTAGGRSPGKNEGPNKGVGKEEMAQTKVERLQAALRVVIPIDLGWDRWVERKRKS